jgi:hypothetical protein
MPYEVKKKGKATLRLYLNDPKILKAIVKKGVLRIPVPLEIEGEWALGKTKDGKLHYLFTHDDFIPVFIDLKGKKDPKQ